MKNEQFESTVLYHYAQGRAYSFLKGLYQRTALLSFLIMKGQIGKAMHENNNGNIESDIVTERYTRKYSGKIKGQRFRIKTVSFDDKAEYVERHLIERALKGLARYGAFDFTEAMDFVQTCYISALEAFRSLSEMEYNGYKALDDNNKALLDYCGQNCGKAMNHLNQQKNHRTRLLNAQYKAKQGIFDDEKAERAPISMVYLDHIDSKQADAVDLQAYRYRYSRSIQDVTAVEIERFENRALLDCLEYMLTERERKVLEYSAMGFPNSYIAESLNTTEPNVRKIKMRALENCRAYAKYHNLTIVG